MLADDAGDVTHYFSCLEFPDFFFLWNIEPPWIFPLNSTGGFGKFHFRDGGVGGLEVGCWFVVGGKVTWVWHAKFCRWSSQFWIFFVEMVGCIFWEIPSFLHVEVIRLAFLDLDEIGPLINQLDTGIWKSLQGIQVGGVVAQKKLEAFQCVSWVLDLPWALWGHVFIWGVGGHMGWYGQKNQQKAFFWSKMDFWPETSYIKIKGGCVFLCFFHPYFLSQQTNSTFWVTFFVETPQWKGRRSATRSQGRQTSSGCFRERVHIHRWMWCEVNI